MSTRLVIAFERIGAGHVERRRYRAEGRIARDSMRGSDCFQSRAPRGKILSHCAGALRSLRGGTLPSETPLSQDLDVPWRVGFRHYLHNFNIVAPARSGLPKQNPLPGAFIGGQFVCEQVDGNMSIRQTSIIAG